MRPYLNVTNVPEYHGGMLLVRIRIAGLSSFAATNFTSGDATVAAFDLTAAPSSTGIAALSFYERAGLIKRVVPVARTVDPDAGSSFAAVPAGLGAVAALMVEGGLEPDGSKAGLAAGLNLIELERDEDRERVQLALASDPNFSVVSRVPVRYITVRRSLRPARADAGHRPGPALAPPSPTSMWNLRKIRWEQARRLPGFVDATGIDVAVLDTGIDIGHPDLQGRVAGYVHAHPDLPAASSPSDIIGHGTHVSGTIAALINNGLGINGICECNIHSWKIFDDRPDLVQGPFGSSYAYFVDPVMYLRALFDCISSRPRVINLSIGGRGRPSQVESDAFRQIIANGTIVVAAMGNEREQGSPISYPAAIPGVIAVGATGLTDRIANFSNRGSHIGLCAPGEAIWSTLPTYPGQLGYEAVIGPDGRVRQGKPQRRETDYDAWPGTSMAAPHVTAAVALYLANGGDPSLAAVKRALADSCDKVEAMGGAAFTADHGHGRLNLSTLLQQAQAGLDGTGAAATS